jgi:hypothetical protein
VAGFVCALAGFGFAFGDRRNKAMRIAGILLVGLGGAGAFLLGHFPGPPAIHVALLALPDAWLEHGGLLTFAALFALWGAGLLYNRFTPA